MICSKVLWVTEVRETGLQVFGSHFFPFMKIRTTLVHVQSLDTYSVLRDWENINATTTATCSAVNLRSLVDIASGPVSFLVSFLVSRLR